MDKTLAILHSELPNAWEGNPKKGREAAAPSFIKEIQEVQGGKKRHTMVVQSSPKMPKWHHSALKAWSILNTRFPGGPKGVDGLPSGHPNLNGSHPGLLKDFPRGILVIEMLPTSL
jgi:hypothetical protein